MKCPICNSTNDHVRFVFAEHVANGKTSHENPSDLNSVFMCPNLHFFDKDGEEILVKGAEKA